MSSSINLSHTEFYNFQSTLFVFFLRTDFLVLALFQWISKTGQVIELLKIRAFPHPSPRFLK